MKLRIRHKLLLAILGANLLIALSFYLLNSWSFRQGFIEYLNQTEEQKFKPMVKELAALYQQKGNWEWIQTEHYLWRGLIRRSFNNNSDNRNPKINQHERSGRRSLRPPPRERGFRPPNRPLPHDRGFRPSNRPFDNEKGRPPRFRPPPPPSSEMTLRNPRLLLADEHHQLVIGREHKEDTIRWMTITSAGKNIGYLGYRQTTQLVDKLDQIFSRQQQQSYAVAAIVLVVVSSIIGLFVAARIVRPVTQLDKAVHQLASGDYEIRLPNHRKDELDDLAQNFNRLATTLKKNQKARQQWIADISHELRTPVAILQGEIEALQDGIRKITSESLISLHTETKHLSHLINDLHELTLSDQGALSYQMETVVIKDVIETSLETYQSMIQNKDLKLDWDYENATDSCIHGDYQRLIQLFNNLLQNTFRYTDTGGILKVRLGFDDSNLVIKWADSKPGVASEQLPLLFDRLYRADKSRSRENGGSGLGLAICKNIVEAHEGSITANHSDLGGLEVEIIFPLSRKYP